MSKLTKKPKAKWNGDAVLKQVKAAAEQAVNETTERAAASAKSSHWWQNRTGQLEGDVKAEPAKWEGARVEGSFGSDAQHDGTAYGLILERKQPWLRPAADGTFKTLAPAIKRKV